MPAIANIVVNDAVPAAHTFAPVTTDGGLARLANRNSTTPQGFETMVVEVKAPTNSQGAHRVRIGIGDPVEVTVSGVTSVDHLSSAEVTFNISQKATLQERKDLLKLMANTLANASIVTVIENIEPIY